MGACNIVPFPEICRSAKYQVFIDGTECSVHAGPTFHFTAFSGKGMVDVRIKAHQPFQTVIVRPSRLGVRPAVLPDGMVCFTLEMPCKAVVEFDRGLKSALCILCNPPEAAPAVEDGHTIRFGPGVHHAGRIEMISGQTVLLEPGAWVVGHIWVVGQTGIRICGEGVLDASGGPVPAEAPEEDGKQRKKHAILLRECADIAIEGITVVNGPTWHVVPVACTGVRIRNVNILGSCGTGDGIDVVGCTDVSVDGCFIRVKDDCVAIKAVDYQFPVGEADVSGVTVENCVFWNDEWGNAMEIGYETRCEEIKDIIFRNIDVVHCEYEGWQSGGVFTIHNGDRAHVHGVRYEDIRVECADEKLIDFKILDSVYSKDKVRGRISDVVLKNISIVDGPFPVSILRGWGEGHLIENVTIENLTVLGQPISNWRDAHMVVEITKGLTFRS